MNWLKWWILNKAHCQAVSCKCKRECSVCDIHIDFYLSKQTTGQCVQYGNFHKQRKNNRFYFSISNVLCVYCSVLTYVFFLHLNGMHCTAHVHCMLHLWRLFVPFLCRATLPPRKNLNCTIESNCVQLLQNNVELQLARRFQLPIENTVLSISFPMQFISIYF